MKRALIVDDDRPTRRVPQIPCERLGLESTAFEAAVEAMKLGAVDFLVKPFDVAAASGEFKSEPNAQERSRSLVIRPVAASIQRPSF